MNNEWKSFISQQGAHFANNRVSHFDGQSKYVDSHTDNIVVDLSHYGLIKASGDDRVTFLHNQLTNDLKSLDINHSHLSGYCSPKGRMLALFRIFQRDNAYYLSLPGDTLEATLKRLRMFVLRSQVVLEDASDTLVHIGFAGPGSEIVLNSEFGQSPMSAGDVIHVDGLTIIRLPGEPARFEIFGPEPEMRELWLHLASNAIPAGADSWDALQISAGQPIVTAANVEAFVPQMANMDAVNGLSFTKGCYPGQEIVARMHYLGKLKRRLYIGTADCSQCPQPGDKLVAGDDKNVGSIVTAVRTADDKVLFSAVIEIAATEEAIHLDITDKPVIALQPLPYPLESR